MTHRSTVWRHATGRTQPRTPPDHGTRAAIKRHERQSEPLCAACRAERSRINAANYQRRKDRT